jgi:beta-1,4-mannosyl-glycoprotein beta-1,4-N-acetylglucosaminyltransferase
MVKMGIVGDYAGHHCSWCFPPEGILVKLMSAQRADTPRWGDYPEKLEINYISNLIKTGTKRI